MSVFETRKSFSGTDDEYFDVVTMHVRGMLALKKLTRSFGVLGERGDLVLGVDFG